MLAVLPPDQPLFALGLVLTAGVAFGLIAKRCHLPSVTGQILIGVLLGPAVLGLFDLDTLHGLKPVIDFALGLMAVEVGSYLHLRQLKNARRRLGALVLLEATLTPALVYCLVSIAGRTEWYTTLLLAALALSTAPATILAIVGETRSKGVFVRTLVAAVALNNLACICLFELAHATAREAIRPESAGDWGAVLLAPLPVVGISLALGGVIGMLLIFTTRHVLRPDRLAALSFMAILLTAGVAEAAGGSTLLACMFLGVILSNLTPDKDEIGHKVFDNFGSAIFAVFFTVAGAELNFRYLLPAGALALLFFVGRAGGKLASGYLAMRWAGATARIRRYLGPALLPQAGLAVGLMLLVKEDDAFAGIEAQRELFLAVVLTVVLLNEIIGPITTRWALYRSGDFGKDRARLIDFLHEEHIVTELDAATPAQAIETLTDHLLATHAIDADRTDLLRAFLAREEEASTCLGSGLAIPHGRLEEGDAIVGVMGISRPGLPFATPDGQPVHCVILLATPARERGRHLEVLAAFAQIIKDRTIRQQLYHAKSPAHAYEVLHADEESEDFNYFLDDSQEEEEGF